MPKNASRKSEAVAEGSIKAGVPNSLGSVPNPDPTQRTIENLQREIAMVKDHLLVVINARADVIVTRLDGMDIAIELLQHQTDKIPSFVKDSVDQLKDVHNEKFRSIDTLFTEKDKRLDQTATDGKMAIAAALQAQKEAAGKAETGFEKRIEQSGTLMGAMQKGFDDKIDEIRLRQQVNVWSLVMGVLALTIAITSLAVSVMGRVAR